MGKKGKKKSNNNNSQKKSNNKKDPKGTKAGSPRGRAKHNHKHKDENWKAGNDDPVRRAVEADGSKTVVDMHADGNCLFRSLSDQLFYDYGNGHSDVRAEVCDYMEAHEDDFRIFLVLDDDSDEEEDASDYESYIEAMRQDGEWGGNLELVAAAKLYRRDIVVFSADLAAFTIPHGSGKGGPNMLVSYHDNDHYNSVRDNSVSKPKPVIKYSTNGDAETNGVEQRQDEQNSVDEANMIATVSRETAYKRPPKKSAPCHCGSGMRYKQCCLKRDKNARKKKNDETIDEEERESMHGDFRVLSI